MCTAFLHIKIQKLHETEKLTVAQLVTEFPTLNGSQRFVVRKLNVSGIWRLFKGKVNGRNHRTSHITTDDQYIYREEEAGIGALSEPIGVRRTVQRILTLKEVVLKGQSAWKK
jgi:hypothetical protein